MNSRSMPTKLGCVVGVTVLLGGCASAGPKPPSSAEEVQGTLEDLREMVLQEVMSRHPSPNSEAYCLGLGGTYRNPIRLPSDDLLNRFRNSPSAVIPLDDCEVTEDGEVMTKGGTRAQAIVINSLTLGPNRRVADAWIQAGLPERGSYTCQAYLGEDGWSLRGCTPMPPIVYGLGRGGLRSGFR